MVTFDGYCGNRSSGCRKRRPNCSTCRILRNPLESGSGVGGSRSIIPESRAVRFIEQHAEFLKHSSPFARIVKALQFVTESIELCDDLREGQRSLGHHRGSHHRGRHHDDAHTISGSAGYPIYLTTFVPCRGESFVTYQAGRESGRVRMPRKIPTRIPLQNTTRGLCSFWLHRRTPSLLDRTPVYGASEQPSTYSKS